MPLIVKRGDTFSFTAVRKSDGTAVTVAQFAIRSQIRSPSGALLVELTVTQLTQSGATLGMFTLVDPYSDTTSWVPGDYRMDIQFTDTTDDTRASTQTVTVRVMEDITRA